MCRSGRKRDSGLYLYAGRNDILMCVYMCMYYIIIIIIYAADMWRLESFDSTNSCVTAARR